MTFLKAIFVFKHYIATTYLKRHHPHQSKVGTASTNVIQLLTMQKESSGFYPLEYTKQIISYIRAGKGCENAVASVAINQVD